MGSLNGDIMVMRNGRSTSQVSVYNYPEHLNPFYEDDQHKRLRFWKINKKDNEGRRNSFSISNLKDMWAFKSFRMKKKSSTLGINKTSESPPLLRRDYPLDNGWNTFDHRLRASNTTSLNDDSFQRNATYRSSLQTLPTNGDRIGLNRNDGYRSTIQVTRSNPRYQMQQQQKQIKQNQTMGVSHNRRYVYGGSVTPQPYRNTRSNICNGPYENDGENAMIRGSSQSSMVSTNPFESDEDEDINSSGMRSFGMNGSTTTLTSRTPRKKRRAPAPPTPVHGHSNGMVSSLPTIRIEPSHDSTQDELRIQEDIDIANLTAEIESFVKTKSHDDDDDDVEATQKNASQTATETSPSIKSLDNNQKRVIETREGESETKAQTEIIPAAKEGVDTLTQEKIKDKAVNGQVVMEVFPKTTTKITTITARESEQKETNVTQISNEMEEGIDENKEIKTNGAIPKKQSNNSAKACAAAASPVAQQKSIPAVGELCIQETCTEEENKKDEMPEKPVPLKRQIKPEAEIGQVECIHVHVESPKATPRKENANGLSSFKSTETKDSLETITNKTPFVLSTPPTQRRNTDASAENPLPVIRETVKIVETTTVNKRTNELNIKEERINTKPEIRDKPILSPKPVTKQANGKIQEFAEIHKPIRRHQINQNGHVIKGSHDGSVSPPSVPCQAEIEKKLNILDDHQTNGICEKKPDNDQRKAQLGNQPSDNLKIVENEQQHPITDKEVKQSNCETVANHREEELDFLYRPKPTSHMEWKRSTLAPLETNIPPEKRKSVKDIIESINRSQRLLNAAANKDFTVLQNQSAPNKTRLSSPNNNNNLDDTAKQISHVAGEVSTPASSPSPSPSNYNNECTDAQKLDNGEIFQKCKVKKEVYDYRESSPITSNLDWNPVPKPKRTKPDNV